MIINDINTYTIYIYLWVLGNKLGINSYHDSVNHSPQIILILIVMYLLLKDYIINNLIGTHLRYYSRYKKKINI
jgi:hypothetical protein